MSKTLIFSNPSVDGPLFRFGEAVPNVEAYYNNLPSIPGTQSSWDLVEWDTPTTLDPSQISNNNPDEYDSVFGSANYSWTNSNGNIGFSVYGNAGAYGYRLSDLNGNLTSGGGQNIFLQTSKLTNGLATFDHPITFDADEAITQVKQGGIAQQIGNNFIVSFNSPGTTSYDPAQPSIGVFLQAELADSRGAPLPYYSNNGSTQIFNVTDGQYLAFAPADHTSHVEINLNKALQDMIANYKTSSPHNSIPSGIDNLANWSLSAAYIGDETSDGGGASLDVQNVNVTIDKSVLYSDSKDPAITIQSDVTPLGQAAPIELTDATTQLSSIATGATYVGPVSYISSEYIWAGADNVAIKAATPNVFLKGGSGDDALTVTTGSNILDGGTGSNFLTGTASSAIGEDTFYVDGRASATTWSTIVNFHSGDQATLWGFDPSKSSVSWSDSMGAAGFQGTTLTSNIGASNVQAQMTFAGITHADLDSHVHITNGSVGTANYLLISWDH